MITRLVMNILYIPYVLFMYFFSPKFYKENRNLIKVTIKYLRDKNDRHPHLIMGEIKDKYISVGLTTQKKKGKNKKAGKNKKLSINPLNDNKISYMRRQATIANKNAYQDNKTGYIDSKDYEVAKAYAEKAKQKYINKKSSQVAKRF